MQPSLNITIASNDGERRVGVQGFSSEGIVADNRVISIRQTRALPKHVVELVAIISRLEELPPDQLAKIMDVVVSTIISVITKRIEAPDQVKFLHKVVKSAFEYAELKF